ncbi:MAG: anti-sigma factor [Acidobacteria bacterium]|nr:anti-sigma factor [Acidobacteriota bacterium]
MSTTGHYDQGDLALFAMQLLPRNEYGAMASHISNCTYCRQELASLQGDLAAYAHTVDMHSPPALTRERFLNQVAREKRFVPLEQPEPERLPPPPIQRVERLERMEAAAAGRQLGYTSRGQQYATGLGSGRYLDEADERQTDRGSMAGQIFSKAFPWIGWAAAAVLAISAGNLYHEREEQRAKLTAQAGTIDRLNSDAAGAKQLLETITDASARQVTLSRANEAPTLAVPQARATYVASKGSLIFLATNLEPIESFKTYELWLIPADGGDPIPAGTFRPDARGNASVILPPLPKGIDAKAFGVTIEAEGGSQTPTMPIVLAGS